MFERSVPSIRETWLSTLVGDCVPAQISADLPSGLTIAVAFKGSIAAWQT